jgi:lipopolysaccharide export system protein LptA
LVCLALTDPLLAEAPVPLRPEELAAIDLQVERAKTPGHAEDTARILAGGEERALATTASMQAFAKRSAVLIANPAPAVAAAEPAAAGEKPGITVQSDGGMYFDAEKNVIVYTKNIRLDEARFQLACDDQLQVFLKSEPKKPEPKPDGEGSKNPAQATPEAKADGGLLGMGGAGVSGIDRIIATGNVRVTSKDPQGNAIVATAETAVYEAQTGAFILKGGLPQIQRGPSYQRALEPGIYIRYTKDGNFEMSEGKKKTFFVLPEKNN